jgi:DNA-binding HxlR family transcriptional regulator
LETRPQTRGGAEIEMSSAKQKASRKRVRACSIWRALEVIGDTSVILILESIWIGARRFQDIGAHTGLQPALLSKHLNGLIVAGVLSRRAYMQHPQRFEYVLTDKGRDLYWLSLMMLRWEKRWSNVAGKIDIRHRHKLCGCAVEPQPVCACCGAEIFARDVDWREGPGLSLMELNYRRRRQQRNLAAERSPQSALLDEAAQITGDRWAGLILRALFSGLRQFDEIKRDTGMASNVLSERLTWLVEKDMLILAPRNEHATRFSYRLSPKGLDYYPIILAIMQWGDKYYADPAGPPVLLFHGADNHPLAPVIACQTCKQPLLLREMESTIVFPVGQKGLE